jgi:uncharacterized protein (TIGR02118 family)
MTMLMRRRDRSLAAFREHWLGRHADIVRAVPQLHRYYQNHIVATLGRAVGAASFNVDGIPELWFLSESDKQAAFASPAAAQLPVDEPNFIEGITIFAIEEAVLTAGKGDAKVLVLRRGSGTLGALDAWCRELESALPGARACTCNRILSADGRPGVTREADPPDAIVELRFADSQAAKAAYAAPDFADFAARCEGRGDAFVSYLVEERVII